MKTDFAARPVYLRKENRIRGHFLICFLTLLSYRLLEKKLEYKRTCEEILDTLKTINFAGIQEQLNNLERNPSTVRRMEITNPFSRKSRFR